MSVAITDNDNELAALATATAENHGRPAAAATVNAAGRSPATRSFGAYQLGVAGVGFAIRAL